MLLVAGAAGIGKTRLLGEAAALAGTGGSRILHARGGAVERDLPWGLVRQLFDPALAELDGDRREALFEGAGELARSVFGASPPAAEPATLASAAYGLYWVLVGLGEDRPIVAIVDDVHWADEESLRWLAFLAPRVAGLPTAIVAGLRTGDPGAGRPPLLEIEADPGVVRVEPGTLSIDAASRLIEHAAGGPPEPGFVSACQEASGGNPFLLQELVSQLTAERIAPTDENAGRVSSLRPSTISRSVLLRLARLPDSAAALARSAAVLGPGHDTRELGALADLDPEAATDAHEALAEAGILTAEPAPGFVHPLIRDAIYSELPGAERSRRHERAARILAASGAAASDVVPHLLEARPSSDPWVRDTLREAGNTALDRGAPDLATRLLRRAREEAVEPADDPALLLELGRADFAARGGPGLTSLAEAVAATSDPDRLMTAALDYGRALHAVGNHPLAARVYRDAFEALDGGPDDARRLMRAHYVYTGLQDSDNLPGALEQLAVAAGELGDGGPADDIIRACLALGTVAAGAPGAELAREALADGWLMAERTPAVGFASAALVWSDELDEAAALWDEALTVGRRAGERPWVAFAACFRAHVALRMGDVAAAEEHARDSCAAADLWDLTPPDPAAFLCEALVERGRAEEAERVLETSGYDPELPGRQGYNPLLFSRAQLHLALGRPEAAADDLRELGRRLERQTILNPAAFGWRSLLARALAGSDPEEAEELATAELQAARAFGAPRAIAIALQALAVVARGDAQIELLREAVDVLDGSPARLERARATVEPRRRAAPSGTQPRGARGASRRSRSGSALRRRRALGAGVGGAADRRREAASRRPARPRRAHGVRGPGRPDGGRRDDEQGDRRGPVRGPAHRRDPPDERLSQARDRLASGARAGAGGLRAARLSADRALEPGEQLQPADKPLVRLPVADDPSLDRPRLAVGLRLGIELELDDEGHGRSVILKLIWSATTLTGSSTISPRALRYLPVPPVIASECFARLSLPVIMISPPLRLKIPVQTREAPTIVRTQKTSSLPICVVIDESVNSFWVKVIMSPCESPCGSRSSIAAESTMA